MHCNIIAEQTTSLATVFLTEMFMFLRNGRFFFLMLLTAGLYKNRVYHTQLTIYAKSTAAKNDGGFLPFPFLLPSLL